jgi:protein-disulfide isomerase-like protein with CxxC motif
MAFMTQALLVMDIEYTDPLCPWAWGSEPTFRRLRYVLGPSVSWRQAFGLLFPESDDRPADVAAETARYHRNLQDIAAHTGAPYPPVLERVARTSRPAAVIAVAARAQGPDVTERVVRRLREHMFLLGTPPDTPGRAIAAVASVPGVDAERLVEEAASGAVAAVVARDAAETPVPEAYTSTITGPTAADRNRPRPVHAMRCRPSFSPDLADDVSCRAGARSSTIWPRWLRSAVRRTTRRSSTWRSRCIDTGA